MHDRHPHDLAKMTWPEAQALFDAKAVAILPVGSTEPHGPHLPLDTDVTIAHAQARRTAWVRWSATSSVASTAPALRRGCTQCICCVG